MLQPTESNHATSLLGIPFSALYNAVSHLYLATTTEHPLPVYLA